VKGDIMTGSIAGMGELLVTVVKNLMTFFIKTDGLGQGKGQA